MKRTTLCVLLVACGKQEPPALAPPAVSSAPSPWAEARAATGHPLLEATAIALGDPEQRAELAVPSRARVLRILVAPGDLVVAGDPLVEVAYPELAAAAASYLAASDQLAAQDARHAQLEGLRAEGLARVSELGAVELDQARLRGERDLAASTLRAAGLDPGGARALVDTGGRSRLRAPIDGVVVKLDVAVGQLRAPESGTLVELVAGGVHRVEAQIMQPLPDRAELVFAPADGRERAARIIRTEPRRDPDGATRVWLEIDGEGVVAGQPGRVRARVGADVVAIPAAAVTPDDHVWRRIDDRRERVPVTVVAHSGADSLVKGLAVGDQVAARAEDLP